EQIGSGDEDLFSGVAFRRVSILRNPKLRRIEPQAFRSSFNVTKELVLEDNELLGRETADSEALFEAINHFSALTTLHLSDSGVRVVPANAFRRPQAALRELFLTDNRIDRVEDNAFTGLPALDLINLDGNQISKLSPSSLNISDTRPSLLRLFLRSNRLQADSFPVGVF